jgi:hypothetical protein
MMGKIARTSLAFGSALLVATAALAADEMEGIIQRHLDWLAANPQFRAEMTFTYGDESGSATLDINRPAGETAFLAKTPGLPQDIYLKTRSRDDKTVLLSFARDLGRTDDIPLRERELPPAPFADGVYDVFDPEDDVAGAMARLEEIAVSMSVEPASQLGVHGLNIVFNEEFMDGVLQSTASFMGQETPPTSPQEVTLWFDGIGRLTGVETIQDFGSPVQVTTLTYPETPIASESSMRPLPLPPAPRAAPPAEPPAAPERSPMTLFAPSSVPVHDLMAPMALSWTLVAGLSVLLGGLSVALFLRMRIHLVEE